MGLYWDVSRAMELGTVCFFATVIVEVRHVTRLDPAH